MLACHFVEHSIGEKEAATLQVGANVPEKFLFDGIHYFTTHKIYNMCCEIDVYLSTIKQKFCRKFGT